MATPADRCTTFGDASCLVLRGKILGPGRARLQDKGWIGGDVGHDEGVGLPGVVQRSRLVTARHEHPQTERSYLEGKAEHGPHAGPDGPRGKGRPSQRAGTGKIGFSHGRLGGRCQRPRSLVEGVLKLLTRPYTLRWRLPSRSVAP